MQTAIGMVGGSWHLFFENGYSIAYVAEQMPAQYKIFKHNFRKQVTQSLESRKPPHHLADSHSIVLAESAKLEPIKCYNSLYANSSA